MSLIEKNMKMNMHDSSLAILRKANSRPEQLQLGINIAIRTAPT